LKSFSVLSSKDVGLRPSSQKEQQEPNELAFPPGILAHREKVILPLGLEFRKSTQFDREDAPENLNPSVDSESLVPRVLSRIPSETVMIFDPKDGPGAFKPKSVFGGVTRPDATTEFYYGPQLKVQSALIDGKALPIREPMARGIFAVAGFDGASCPILYVRLRGGGDLVKIGSVLTESHGVAAQAVQIVRLPLDSADIILAEEEPEISSIDELEVRAVFSDGSMQTVSQLREPRKIRSGSFISLAVPAVTGASYYELRVSGYYDTYPSLLSERSR
jgi:hypothetical protein